MFILRPQKCMYHLNHNIISFCKCQSCLLPVCEVCTRIHKNQHSMYKTEPIFQSIQSVLNQVHSRVTEQIQLTNVLKSHLAKLPENVHSQQAALKYHFKSLTRQIFNKFQQIVQQLEVRFLAQMSGQEIGYIKIMEGMEKQLQLTQKHLKNQMNRLQELKSQDRMQTIIQFYSSEQEKVVMKHYQIIKEKIAQLTKFQISPNFQPLKILQCFLDTKLTQFKQPNISDSRVSFKSSPKKINI